MNQVPNEPPQVTAAGADWQLNGEALFYSGAYYYPTGPTVFFDGNVMYQTGVYRGVPVYSDATLEPFSIVYVPIGRNIMRPYERPRTGPLASTVGSRPPAFPIQRESEVKPTPPAVLAYPYEPPATDEPVEAPRPVATTGTTARTPATPAPTVHRPTSAGPAATTPPNRRVWVQFNGARWQSMGDAVPYVPERFKPIGEYHGFPVYRAAVSEPDAIYIPAVRDGPLTRYERTHR